MRWEGGFHHGGGQAGGEAGGQAGQERLEPVHQQPGLRYPQHRPGHELEDGGGPGGEGAT